MGTLPRGRGHERYHRAWCVAGPADANTLWVAVFDNDDHDKGKFEADVLWESEWESQSGGDAGGGDGRAGEDGRRKGGHAGATCAGVDADAGEQAVRFGAVDARKTC